MKRNVALRKEDNCDSEDTKISEDLSNEEDQSQRLDNKLSYKTAAPTHNLDDNLFMFTLGSTRLTLLVNEVKTKKLHCFPYFF